MEAPLTYAMKKPMNIEEGKKYPVFYLIHGMGSNEQDLPGLVAGLEENYFIFSIRGPIAQPPGFAFFTMEEFGKPHRDVFDETIGKLQDFVSYTVEKYPIDAESLHFLGFSQGAILSMTMGIVLGNQVKGVAAISGYLPEFVKHDYEKKDVSEMKLFLSHGKLDPVLPYEWAPASEAFFKEQHANVEFHSYESGHNISRENFEDLRAWIEKL